MKKPRVLYFSYSLVPSYTANAIAVMNQCNELQKVADLTVVCFKGRIGFKSDYRSFYQVDKMKLIRLPESFLKTYGMLYKIFALLLVVIVRPDMVYSRDIVINHFLSEYNVVNIYEIHQINHLDENFDRDFKQYLSKIKDNRSFKGIVCIAEVLRQECIALGFRKEDIYVSHSGVRDAFFLLKLKVRAETDRWQILYSGSFQVGKGIDLILRIASAMPECDFILIGKKHPHIDSNHTNLRMVGWQESTALMSYIAKADITLVPYKKQRYMFYSPLKLFEYMAAGKVVIASRLPGIDEIVVDGWNGLMIEDSKVESFVKAIKRAMSDQDLVRKLQKNARRTARAYTWQKRANQIVEIINKRVNES